MERIINRIVEIRKSKKLSQEEVAIKLGITKGNYNRLENGHTSITVERLFELSEIFRCDISYLLQIEIDPTLENKLRSDLKIASEKIKELEVKYDHLDRLVWDKSMIASSYEFQLRNISAGLDWTIKILEKFEKHPECEAIIKSEFHRLVDQQHMKNIDYYKKADYKNEEDRQREIERENRNYKNSDFWTWINWYIERLKFLNSDAFLGTESIFSAEKQISDAPFSTTSTEGRDKLSK